MFRGGMTLTDRLTTATFMQKVETASVLTQTMKILDTRPVRLAVPVVVAILVEEVLVAPAEKMV